MKEVFEIICGGINTTYYLVGIIGFIIGYCISATENDFDSYISYVKWFFITGGILKVLFDIVFYVRIIN